MLRADVIRHLVLNNLYAERMGFLDQLAQRRQIAEAIFDARNNRWRDSRDSRCLDTTAYRSDSNHSSCRTRESARER